MSANMQVNERVPLSIEEILDAVDGLVASPDEVLLDNPQTVAGDLLAMGEDILDAWIRAAGNQPTMKKSEGFRLLALHKQASRGDPSFNACRETCREIVYHHNVVLADPDCLAVAKTLRLGAMVVRHLALFAGGKLENAGLGEFCCSSRGIRQADDAMTRGMKSLDRPDHTRL
ncbi:MAG: hypothetical protein R3D34_18720 [Nitratireductor sp.]